MLRRTTHIALGTALVAAAATFAPVAHADRIGFNVSIGGPGYGVSFGNAPYWSHQHHYRPAWRPVYVAPPVVYARPRVVYVAPPVRVVYRAPYLRYPVVVRRPVYYR
ncbi:MAG: virulence factor [Casimicrobiaceae bacterium]